MLSTLLEIAIAPALVGAASLAARRWGARAGGQVSAFPAVVGPLLLITADEHGTAFTAAAANGTLIGLVALSGFALVYGRVGLSAGWAASMTAGWAAAAVLAALVGAVAAGPPAGLLIAIVALGLAHRGLPRQPAPHAQPALPRSEIPLRMGLTAALVALLAAGANRFGALVGGILAALPVLASVLAVFTHRRQGREAMVALLRGMLAGMASFVAFCELIAVLIVPIGAAGAFAAATVAALAAQAITAQLSRRVRPETAQVGPKRSVRIRAASCPPY